MVNYKLVVLGEGGVGKSGESQLTQPTHPFALIDIQLYHWKRLNALTAVLQLCLAYDNSCSDFSPCDCPVWHHV